MHKPSKTKMVVMLMIAILSISITAAIVNRGQAVRVIEQEVIEQELDFFLGFCRGVIIECHRRDFLKTETHCGGCLVGINLIREHDARCLEDVIAILSDLDMDELRARMDAL